MKITKLETDTRVRLHVRASHQEIATLNEIIAARSGGISETWHEYAGYDAAGAPRAWHFYSDYLEERRANEVASIIARLEA